MDSDFLLIRKMKEGDSGAIDSFVHKYYSKILQYCRMHINDAGSAEDITQETFERFFRSFEQYRHYGKAENYLYVIAGNLCRDYYRKKSELPTDKIFDEQTDNISFIEQRLYIQAAFDALPQELKEVSIMFFCGELKQREIARILNISLPLVKYRIKRSREILKQHLSEEDIQ